MLIKDYVQAVFLTSENKIIRCKTTQQMQSRIKIKIFLEVIFIKTTLTLP